MHHRPALPRDARATLRPLAVWAVLACSAAPLLCHAQLSPNARKEIDGLLAAVGSSGCEFMRSGKAHPAAEAQQHLQKKYDYLATRDKLSSTEDFIVKAATRSSMTGEAYGIRCGSAPQQPSEDWMKARLKEMRTGQPR